MRSSNRNLISELCLKHSISEDIENHILQQFHIDELNNETFNCLNHDELVYDNRNNIIGFVVNKNVNLDLEEENCPVINIKCLEYREGFPQNFRIGNLFEVKSSDIFFSNNSNSHYVIFTHNNYILNFLKV